MQPYGNPAAVMAGAAAQADAPSGGGGGWRTFLGLRFYAKFFNVDTQVLPATPGSPCYLTFVAGTAACSHA